MALNSINTNIAAYFAQQNIDKASSKVALSIGRLSSGNRIVRAADDVAAMSAGTSLRTNVTTLKMALINTSQGASLLQVADGALAQITDILQRQKAISVQANSGSLTADERGFLNQEFTNLTAEIDRLVGNTNFNGVTLLDGSLLDDNSVSTTTTAASAATGSITFDTNAMDASSIILNGVTFTATTMGATGATIFTVGTTIAETIDNLVNVLNASTNVNISQATYSRSGNSLVITQDAGGRYGNQYLIENGTAGTWLGAQTTISIAGQAFTGVFNNAVALQGGTDNGLYVNSTIGRGVIGDGVITAQNQVAAFATLTLTDDTTEIADSDTITIDDGAGGSLVFTFKAAANITGAATEILIGATNEETLQNAVSVLNSYVAPTMTPNDYGLRQLEFRRDGTTLIVTNRNIGDALEFDGATALTIAANLTGMDAFSNAAMDNGVNTGVNTSGVMNDAFVGQIQGFSATYSGSSNTVTMQVTVGDHTYTAAGVSTNPVANTTVRFHSDSGGGYFDIQMAAGQGSDVLNQSQADQFAERINAAFEGLTFYQTRLVNDYTAAGDIVTDGTVTGSLVGTSFKFTLGDFSEVNLDSISVSAPPDGVDDGIIEFTVNGELFRSSSNLGDSIGANEIVRFTSLTNPNNYITFTNGDTAIDFTNDSEAANFQAALEDAFGLGEGGAGIDFQVGVTTQDTMRIAIGKADTNTIFGGESLDVLTIANASHASDVIDLALDAITSIRAEVGAMQSRFDFAAANIQISVQNQDAARGVLLDTDVAAEATMYATAQVQLQAGISVLAQANLIPQNLLKLIG